MSPREIKRYCNVKEDAEKLLESAINKLGLSARAFSRVLKVGRTIADLAGADNGDAKKTNHQNPSFYEKLRNVSGPRGRPFTNGTLMGEK